MRGVLAVDQVRAALAYLSAAVPRDEWVRIGMAIKSEFPGEDGFALFDEWSAGSPGYSSRDASTAWRSIKPAGGVSIGTLLYQAQALGFQLQGEGRRAAPRQVQQGKGQRADAESREAAQATAAQQAAQLWERASTMGESAYLARKCVQPFGVRFAPDGCLLVPVRDGDGQLHNLQRIAPQKPASRPEKLFLTGGRKSGLWHMLGDPSEAAVLLVAEGYATAATLHQATGRPVAVAFDAGNLQPVAKNLRRLHGGALLVLCGDDDAETAARTGKNPGREKAAAAARAVDGLAVFPDGLPPGGSDFNDLHQHVGGAAGLAQVRELIEAAIQARQATQQAAGAAKGGGQGRRGAPPSSGPPRGPDDGDEAYEPFRVDDAGVWHMSVDRDNQRKLPEWICSRLDVVACTRDQDGGGWGYLLQFADPLGHAKQWAMPARMLSGDGAEYRGMLLAMGLRIDASPRARNLLTRYIQTRTPQEYAQCTDRIGWHGTAFVLPRETVGDDAERIVFQTDGAVENTFRVKGSAEQWRQRVGVLCAGNSRLVFAVSCAFAGPLLRPAGMESGGFHFRGDSSSGKTTALKVAASVYGGAGYLQRWRTTDNALEAIAAQHCDATLILDELAQVDPKTAGECAYMLANEQSKARSTRNAQARPRLTWRLLFLSAGEVGLADHMAEGMKRTRTGQEVRMADIPVDAGTGMGAFEDLHDRDGGAAFARDITRQALACHGGPGRAFIEWACTNAETLSRRVREAQANLAAQLVPQGASGQVERVGARFALVGVAGELATEAGLTGWAPGESERAARACFNAWLAARGGIGNGEVVSMLRCVRRYLEMHGEGRFTIWHRAADDHSPKTLQRAGFRRMLNADGEPIKSNSQHFSEFGERMPSTLADGVSYEYFILPEVFRTEVAAGFDARTVARVLRDHDCLVTENGGLMVKPRLPGMGNTYCYRVTPRIFGLDL